MTDKRIFRLVSNEVRQRAIDCIWGAPDASRVVVSDPARTGEQNDAFHAICTDLAKLNVQWAGKPRSAAQWKTLLVSGHAKATNEEFEIVPGLEGEFINIRESTALMSKKRGASLIEYSRAFLETHRP